MSPRVSQVSRRRRLDSKLTAYSIAGAAALLAPQVAKADGIAYSGTVNLTSQYSGGTNAGQKVYANLPSGVLDFQAQSNSLTVDFGPGVQVVTGFYGSPSSLNAGDTIGAGSSFSSNTTSPAMKTLVNSGSTINYGKFSANGGNGYLGFYFTDLNSQLHYGWADLVTSLDGTTGNGSVDLVSYAYNTTAGASITAGQTGTSAVGVTPEPSALSLVALGATGLAYLRRRKHAVAA